MSQHQACERCLERTRLLVCLSGHLDRSGARLFDALALEDRELLAALGGRRRMAIERQLARFDPRQAARRWSAVGSEQICRCDPAYPARLAELPNPPAILHVVGGMARFLALAEGSAVAIVGTRRASSYGLESASYLARGLAAAGVPVVSGMAFGIDSAAHLAALDNDGATVAVLPGGPDRPYPAAKRGLARRVPAAGALVSELPPGTIVRRWMFPARNRIIAALAAMTIVVEATEHSGALITASVARDLGRRLGAVPGRINSRLAEGPNDLIASGASLVRTVDQVLDELFGPGCGDRISRVSTPELGPVARAVLEAIGDGADTAAALRRGGFAIAEVLAALGELELAGCITRAPGGQLTPTV